MSDFKLFEGVPEHHLPEDPVSRADIQKVLKDGYVILKDVFTKAEAEEAKAEMRRMQGVGAKVGRNNFEGLNTNRIYALLNKTRVFDKFCTLPRVLALNDFFLDEGYNISVFHTIQINSGEKPQELHYDDGSCQLPRPRRPMGTAIMLAFDDFTETNGATRIVPGSHEWSLERLPTEADAVNAVCPAGSAVYFIGTAWHGGGMNRSEKPRMSATVQYCQPYIRPVENQILAVDPRRLPDIPPRIMEMMGYRIHKPFIGYADGLHPLRGVKRMVERLQKPLEKDPPTFPTEAVAKL